MSHPVLPNFSFDTVPLCRLSFLNCSFIFPSPSAPSSNSPSTSASSFILIPDSALLTSTSALTPALWHCRLGHLGIVATKAILIKDYATGIEYSGNFDHSRCIPCLIRKRPQQSFHSHGHCSAVPGELLHMDTCGPFPTLTPHKHSFFLAILEDNSHFGYTGLLQKKNDAYSFYCNTEATVKLVTGNQVHTVRMDCAPELCDGKLGDHIRG